MVTGMGREASKVFFIADLHFGDEGIIRYENRPFGSAEEMDRQLADNWNSVVSGKDTVFVLGDFSCYGEDKDREILNRLRGRKILVKGNHDRHRSSEEWRRLGFAECVEWPVVYEDFFILSHEPVYLNENMPYANFFGHVHNNPAYRTVSGQSYCVSAERIGFTPVLFEEVCERMKQAGDCGGKSRNSREMTESVKDGSKTGPGKKEAQNKPQNESER